MRVTGITYTGHRVTYLKSLGSLFSSEMNILRIAYARLEELEQQFPDSDIKLEHQPDINRRIEAILKRQLIDGLLSYADYAKYVHINKLWSSVLNQPGHLSRKILKNLLRLKQIDRRCYQEWSGEGEDASKSCVGRI